MILTLLTVVHDVPLDQRRMLSPIIFGIIKARGFITLKVVPWDVKLSSLPHHKPCLIDATLYTGYHHPPTWPRGYPDLADACEPLGHVAFSRDKILNPNSPKKWFDYDVHSYLEVLINRARSLTPAC